jgi:hypothetical protein
LVNKIEGDPTIWFSYPKKSSKNVVFEINRDTGWDIMGTYNFEPVHHVPIDDTWSALRFKNVEYIKNITRKESFALSKQAKERTSKKGQ